MKTINDTVISNRESLGWLLTRDNHVAPIFGLSPQELRRSKKLLVRNPEFRLKSTYSYNAIVDCLGFKGDWGDYQHTQWPRLLAWLHQNGLYHQANLFDVPSNDLFFGLMRLKRRDLADRLFLQEASLPHRVFLGSNYDWSVWDELRYMVHVTNWSSDDDQFEPQSIEDARRWVYRHRLELYNFVQNFLGDQLFDVGRPYTPLVMAYNRDGDVKERQRLIRRTEKVMRVLRWVLEQEDEGWVRIRQYNDNLIVLGGPDGTYDFIWRELRDAPPPSPDLKADSFDHWDYFRRGVWRESEEHRAALFCCENGRGGLLHSGLDVVRAEYLRLNRQVPADLGS